jgi:hypothetical protein
MVVNVKKVINTSVDGPDTMAKGQKEVMQAECELVLRIFAAKSRFLPRNKLMQKSTKELLRQHVDP